MESFDEQPDVKEKWRRVSYGKKEKVKVEVSAIDTHGTKFKEYTFDKKNSVKLDMENKLIYINQSKTAIEDIDTIKIERNLTHLYFTKLNVFIGSAIFLFFGWPLLDIFRENLIYAGIWLVFFYFLPICGGFIGGLKKVYVNSRIYFFIKNEPMECIRVKHSSGKIRKQLEMLAELEYDLETMEKNLITKED